MMQSALTCDAALLRREAMREATSPLHVRARLALARRIDAISLFMARHRNVRRALIIGLVLALGIATLMVFSDTALAAPEKLTWENIKDPDEPKVDAWDPGSWIAWLTWFLTEGLLGNTARLLLRLSTDILQAITTDTILTATYDSMLSGTANGIGATITRVSNAVILPCANTILAIVILLHLITVAQKIDQAGGTLPTVREVMVMFVTYALLIYCVNNADGIMKGIYELVRLIVSSLSGEFSSSIKTMSLYWDFDRWGDFMTILLLLAVGAINLIASLFAYGVSMFMGLSRAIEIYIMTMFAPVPFAFMGFNETKQWGIGYIRSYIAVALSAAIMIVILYFFPLLLDSFAVPPNSFAEQVTSSQTMLDVLFWSAKLLVCDALLIMTMLKSGMLASKIFGNA